MDAESLIRNTTEKALERFRSAVILRERSPSKWAEEERYLASGGPLARGEAVIFTHDLMPHCVEIMDRADDEQTNIIVIWAGRRMGKTENICTNIIGRTVTDKPGNIISMWPVEDSRDRFSRDVIEKTIVATPALSNRFVERKSRDTGRTIGFKGFAGGSLIINYSGSKSQTKGMAAAIVLAHEVDAYPVSSQGEGDPIEKLFGRSEGFPDAIKIVESTGTFSAERDERGKKIYRSNIEKWYDRGDQRKWFCKCRACGHEQWTKWEQIKHPDGKPEDAAYHCEACDAAHNEAQWRKIVLDGKWKATAPFKNAIRSYWINGFSSLLPKGRGFKSKLHQFVVEGTRALNGTPEERQVWINEVKCELTSTDENSQEPPSYIAIVDGRENYANDERIIIPQRAMILTNSTDLHGNRLEVNWTAWAKDEESWNLKHQVIFGNTEKRDVWEEWKEHLRSKFLHESGHEIGMTWGLIDGNWRIDPILVTLLELRQVHIPGVSGLLRMSRGVGKPASSVVIDRWGTIEKRAKGVIVGTWTAKSLIYERLRAHTAKEKGGPGFIHFGTSYTEEFIRQSVSERSVMKIINGREIETWKNPEGNRNEALDLLVGNLAAFRFNKWDWEAREKLLVPKTSAPKKEEEKDPEPEPQQRNWITGGAKW